MTGCQCNLICYELALAEMHEVQVGTTKALSEESAGIAVPSLCPLNQETQLLGPSIFTTLFTTLQFELLDINTFICRKEVGAVGGMWDGGEFIE